jgi:hypothetical protein
MCDVGSGWVKQLLEEKKIKDIFLSFQRFREKKKHIERLFFFEITFAVLYYFH